MTLYTLNVNASKPSAHRLTLLQPKRAYYCYYSLKYRLHHTSTFRDNPHWRQMLSEVARLLTLYLCIPVISCTAERSFFLSLQRLKTFLRNTLVLKRLNHASIAVLHVNKDLTDNIDLHELCNEFIRRNDMHKNPDLKIHLIWVYR